MSAQATRLEAHRLRPDGSGSEVVHDRVASDLPAGGALPADRFAAARLAPALAVVLGADVPAGTLPEAVRLAAPGCFLALEVRGAPGGDAFLVAERLLPLQLDGALRLYLGGRAAGETAVAALGDPAVRLAWLASRTGGLRAGELVLLGGDGEVAARSGTVEVWGPLGSTLTTTLSEDES
jgi:2-keto-4-pentenoate hydratase